MTVFTNQTILNFANSPTGSALTNGMGLIMAALLVLLLVDKIVLDAYEGKPDESRTGVFAIVIPPLALTMIVIGILRIMQVLKL